MTDSNSKAVPVRLQRRRVKGFHLESPNGLPIVMVTRPGKWGNPFRVGMGSHDAMLAAGKVWRVRIDFQDAIYSPEEAVKQYRWCMMRFGNLPQLRKELRGKNLACFCGLDKCCHADFILEMANQRTPHATH